MKTNVIDRTKEAQQLLSKFNSDAFYNVTLTGYMAAFQGDFDMDVYNNALDLGFKETEEVDGMIRMENGSNRIVLMMK